MTSSRMKRIHVAFIAAGGLLLFFSMLWGALYLYAAQQTVPGDATIGTIRVGGLRLDAALVMVDVYADRLEKRTVEIEGPNGKVEKWSLREAGYRVETAIAREALLELARGGLWERAKYRHRFPSRLETTSAWNRKPFDALIAQHWGWLEAGEPVNASRTIMADDRVVYRPGINAYRVDREAIFGKAAKWAADETGAAYGLPLAQSVLRLKLPITVIEPAVTLEQLRAEGVERNIVSFTTDLGQSGAGRVFNVAATARTLNNWELAPDEVFDYREIVAATQSQYGYREAPVILNGELTPGIGGGICQISSTLYNAALRAGLEIVERRNHSLPVSYVEKGQDATFADGAINFRFRNSTGKHLIIRSAVVDGRLTVKLFGTLPDNVRYDIESEMVRTIAPPVREVPSEGAVPGDRTVLRTGKPGFVVETYRTQVRDGAVVSRERVSRDTYRPQPTIVGVAGGGASGEPAPGGGAKPLLEDGVQPSGR
jgi:vancomycin resistance protein YoaR